MSSRTIGRAALKGMLIGALCSATLPVFWSAQAQADPGCADVAVVVARGTNEPGTLGTIVGDPLYAKVRGSAQVTTTSYAVDYPANPADPTSVRKGVADVVEYVTVALNKCPNQRFVMVGYSEGAIVMHGVLGEAAPLVPSSIAPLESRYQAPIVAVALFGDPGLIWRTGVPQRHRDHTRTYCASGDPVCQLGGALPLAHVAYGAAVDEAAGFIAGRL
ncbi:cutinase family protein [Nocardia sp. NBC_01377]|uniref:cutinase family protein n=1 Tax=Nocardia sp. NBC_01377 TaxID=2903595 RepID=UPI00324C6089